MEHIRRLGGALVDACKQGCGDVVDRRPCLSTGLSERWCRRGRTGRIQWLWRSASRVRLVTRQSSGNRPVAQALAAADAATDPAAAAAAPGLSRHLTAALSEACKLAGDPGTKHSEAHDAILSDLIRVSRVP